MHELRGPAGRMTVPHAESPRLATQLRNWTHYELGEREVLAYKVFGVDAIGRLCSCSAFSDERVYPSPARTRLERCENYFPDLTTRCVPAIYSARDLPTALKYMREYIRTRKYRDLLDGWVVTEEYVDGGIARGLVLDWDEAWRRGLDLHEELPYSVGHWRVVGRTRRLVLAEVLVGGRISLQDTRVSSETMRIWRVM